MRVMRLELALDKNPAPFISRFDWKTIEVVSWASLPLTRLCSFVPDLIGRQIKSGEVGQLAFVK